jgi:hypothetical protein
MTVQALTRPRGYNRSFTLWLAALLRGTMSGERFRYVVLRFSQRGTHVASRLNGRWPGMQSVMIVSSVAF